MSLNTYEMITMLVIIAVAVVLGIWVFGFLMGHIFGTMPTV